MIAKARMQTMNQLYKDWTSEDFAEAIYCGVCGLPLIPDGLRKICPLCDLTFEQRESAMVDALTAVIKKLCGNKSKPETEEKHG